MPAEVPAILRAMEGLREFCGRTLVVQGPPASGKSALLEEIAERAERLAARVVRLRGSYSDRLVPFAGLRGLRGGRPEVADGVLDLGDDTLPEGLDAPMAPVAVNPEALPRSHRRRPERAREISPGAPSRSRGAEGVDLATYWEELLPEFRGGAAHPVVLLADDAAYLDPESRAFLLQLGVRARLRPLLLALALDPTVPAAALWQEALATRADTEWVRQPGAGADPREVRRLHELLERLPERTARVVGVLALLGGDVPEFVLGRTTRLGLVALSDVLVPASESGLVRVRQGRASFPDRGAARVLVDLIPEGSRAAMHREIAEALEALSPEPTFARRVEVARHYLGSRPGATAMSRLVSAAEVGLDLLSYDTATELLEEAFACLVTVPPSERRSLEPELRLYLARALFFGGRPSEGETHLREGIGCALEAGTPSAELAASVEPLLVAIRAVGPRTSLVAALTEIAERCHAGGRIEVEILVDTVATELLTERGLGERARAAALRVADLARHRPERHLQAMGLFAMGLALLDGGREQLEEAERYLRGAHQLLANARRWGLDYLVSEFEVRLVERKGELDQARHLRQASISVLASEKLPTIELAHQIGLAGLELDRGGLSAAEPSLGRAHSLADTMHLLPPSPQLLRLWLLKGRRAALLGDFEGAREFWSALVDLPPDASVPRLRAEAILRLALLEQSRGHPDNAASLVGLLEDGGTPAVLPREWQGWTGDVAALAPRSQHGGGALPVRGL